MQITNLIMKIDINKITETWEKISKETNNPGKYSRNIFIDSKTPIRASVVHDTKFKSVDFFFDEEIANKVNINFKETKGIKVDIDKDNDYKKKLILSIYLKNNSFIDTYLKLLEKIISAIYKIDKQDSSLHKIITHLSSWRKCFEDENYEGLSREEELGLFGELSYIKEIFSKDVSPEEILTYWQGPDRSLHDFKHPNFLVEVKSFSKKNNKIRINNINQLNHNFFKNIYLSCFDIEQNNSGNTITSLINDMKKNIFKDSIVKEKFEEKLNSYGFFEIHQENYLNKFKVNNVSYYKLEEDFPTILPNKIKKGIIDVIFSIELDKCDKFKCNDEFINKK